MKSDSKTDFYSYKNGKMYSTCKVCFNEKVRCDFCNKELNKRFFKVTRQEAAHATQLFAAQLSTAYAMAHTATTV